MDLTRFKRTDPGARFDAAYARGERMAQDDATYKAGNHLRSNNTAAARDALYGAGMIGEAQGIEDRQAKQEAQRAAGQRQQEEEALKFTMEAAGRLRQLYDDERVPAEQKAARVLAGFEQLVPQWRRLGETDEEIADLRTRIQQDPETTLTVLGAGAAKQAGLEVRQVGDEVLVIGRDGKLVSRYRASKTMSVPEGGAVYQMPGEYGGGAGMADDGPEGEGIARPPPQASSEPRLLVQRPPRPRATGGGDGAGKPPSGYRWNGGELEFIPGGPADPKVKSGSQQRRVPAKVLSGYSANAASISQIDAAIADIKANPSALGLKNKFGDDINQRLDPKGVAPRARVADIGSLKLHDRSGAAVTASESPRLMPFIPQVTDRAEAAIKKLQLLKEQYQSANDQIDVQFGEESGYVREEAPQQRQPVAPAQDRVIRYDARGNRIK